MDTAGDPHLSHPIQNAGVCCLTRGWGAAGRMAYGAPTGNEKEKDPTDHITGSIRRLDLDPPVRRDFHPHTKPVPAGSPCALPGAPGVGLSTMAVRMGTKSVRLSEPGRNLTNHKSECSALLKGQRNGGSGLSPVLCTMERSCVSLRIPPQEGTKSME